MREPNKKLLEINYLDYKNNNFEKLLLNKITKDEFLNSKFMKNSDTSSTILLTDIETMPINIQNILVVQLKSKNASSSLISKNTKFIATSSRNMKQILSNNNFSSELFYFLSMYNIFTLPLRERKEDIKILVKEIIAEFNLSNKIDKTLEEDSFPFIRGIYLARKPYTT